VHRDIVFDCFLIFSPFKGQQTDLYAQPASFSGKSPLQHDRIAIQKAPLETVAHVGDRSWLKSGIALARTNVRVPMYVSVIFKAKDYAREAIPDSPFAQNIGMQ
jgi:hypothetical protein